MEGGEGLDSSKEGHGRECEDGYRMSGKGVLH